MAIFASFVHCFPSILHTWPHDSFQVIRLSMTLGIFQGHWTASHQISQKSVWYGKSYYRVQTTHRKSYTIAFDWCHFWWHWSTFESYFSLGCHFHVHFNYPWHAFASHGLPAIAELLIVRCGRSFNITYYTHYLLSVPGKEVSKSVDIWWSYEAMNWKLAADI